MHLIDYFIHFVANQKKKKEKLKIQNWNVKLIINDQ